MVCGMAGQCATLGRRVSGGGPTAVPLFLLHRPLTPSACACVAPRLSRERRFPPDLGPLNIRAYLSGALQEVGYRCVTTVQESPTPALTTPAPPAERHGCLGTQPAGCGDLLPRHSGGGCRRRQHLRQAGQAGAPRVLRGTALRRSPPVRRRAGCRPIKMCLVIARLDYL